MSPSSRGLGHHPFTVSTGVRIPLGTPDKAAKFKDLAAFLFFGCKASPARAGDSKGIACKRFRGLRLCRRIPLGTPDKAAKFKDLAVFLFFRCKASTARAG